MRARTASALTAVASAFVAAAVLGAPTTAQARPEAAYPAPEPAVRVSAASITTGNAVRLSGRSFLAGEPISISVRYRITPNSGSFGNPWGVNIKGDRRAGDDGRFSAKVRLSTPGYATIKVTGKKSHTSATVTVRVLAWRSYSFGGDDFFAGTPLGPSYWDGGRTFGPNSGGRSPFRLSGNETAVADAGIRTDQHKTYGGDVVAGLLGLAALIGSGFVTRRRRTP